MRRPFTRTWPWAIIWRAPLHEGAKPKVATTLMRRRSRSWSRLSPVLPGMLRATSKTRRNCRSERPYARLSFCVSRSLRP